WRLRLQPLSRKKNALEQSLVALSETLRPVFADRRTFERFQRLACGLLATEGRHTITPMMQATGRADCDWSGDCLVFSRSVWSSCDVFRHLLPSILDLYPRSRRTIVASLDDTN